MNHLLKLKHCRYFMRNFFRNAYKHNINNSICNSHLFGIQFIHLIDSSYIPCIYSNHQIREFAKRAQGKIPKGGKIKKMQLTDEEMADVIDIDDYHQQLNAVVDKLKKDYVDHLSIRSAIGNVENIMVKIDDEEYHLNELAVISKKNPTLIAINMSDFPQGLKPAIQAIINSGSGFNPQQDGTMIYLNVPKMTKEHRENLAKNAKTLYMKAKDEIRLIQNSFVKEAKEKTELSEDLVFNATNQIMAMAEHCTADLEKVMKTKQAELLGDS